MADTPQSIPTSPRLPRFLGGSVVHFVGRALARLGSLTFIALLARVLPASEVGEFAYLLTIGLLLVAFLEFGQAAVVTRELATESPASSLWSGLAVKAVIALTVTVSAGPWLWGNPKAAAYGWLGLAMAIDGLTGLALAHARCRRLWLRISTVDVVRYWGPPVLFMVGREYGWVETSVAGAISCVAGASVSALALALLLEGRYLARTARMPLTPVRAFVSVGFVLFLINLAIGFNNRLDILMLQALDRPVGVALYATAYALINGLMLLPQAITFVVFPDLARLEQMESNERALWLERLTRWVVLAGAAAGIGVAATGRPILDLVYGEGYVAGEPVLLIMSLALPFIFLSNVYWNLLVSQNAQSRILRYMMLGAVLNVVLNSILVPWLSIRGAALSTLIVEAAICFQAFAAVRRLPTGRRVRWPAPAGAATVLAFLVPFLAIRPMEPRAAIAVAALLGLVAATGLGLVRLNSRALSSSQQP